MVLARRQMGGLARKTLQLRATTPQSNFNPYSTAFLGGAASSC
jgi:hypothetical protein